jgi:hypothetical protein
MWGRLDASSFLFALLAKHHEMLDDQPGRAVSEARQREVQAAIVREEAPLVCDAVLADAAAGAESRHGRKLVPLTVGWDDDGPGPGATDAATVNRARWTRMRAALLATVPAAAAAATTPAAAEEAPVLVTAAVGTSTGGTATGAVGDAGATGATGAAGGHDGVGFPNVVSAQVTGPDPDDVTDDDVAAAAVFLQQCHIGEEHITDELGTSLVARVGLRAAATTLTVARGAGLPMKSILDKLLVPVRGVSLIANRYAQALRPRPADRHDLAWVARIATEVLAALAFLDVLGVNFGVLRPFIWGGFSAMLLTLLAFAPLTTALTIGGVGLVGLAMAWPDSWLPDDAPRWLVDLLPLKGWIGIPVVLAALLIVSFPKVDRVDRFLRRLLSR